MKKLFEDEIELDKEYGKVFFEYNVKEGAEKLHEFFKRIESLTVSEVSDLEISPEDNYGNIEKQICEPCHLGKSLSPSMCINETFALSPNIQCGLGLAL